MDDELKSLVALNVCPGIGPLRFAQLLSVFGTATGIYTATDSDIRNCGLPGNVAETYIRFRRSFDVSRYLTRVSDKHILLVPYTSELYPPFLSQITDRPFLLYVKGNADALAHTGAKSVAVVGTRRMTGYGKAVTTELTSGLVSAGCQIVSGMAWGIDAVAHRTALDANGVTVAVLGCGVDVIAPASNTDLYTDIQANAGAVISEIPVGVRPNKGMFPARNRIISGLSAGVVVTEGPEHSGALITARFAAEQGREVFAVPGPVTSPTSRGPAILIKNGAKLVETVADILEEIGLSADSGSKDRQAVDTATLAQDELKIYNLLVGGRHTVDELVQRLQLPVSCISAALTVLEVRGIVKNCGDTIYQLA